MHSFVNRLLGRAPESAAHIAKQRLQLVLAQDRSQIPAETLEVLKDEIIAVISRHIDIDRAHVAVSISHEREGNRLVADIPVLGIRGLRKHKNR